MPGHTFLYSPPVNKVQELIAAGQLGEIYFISTSRVNLGLHQPDVSVVWDSARTISRSCATGSARTRAAWRRRAAAASCPTRRTWRSSDSVPRGSGRPSGLCRRSSPRPTPPLLWWAPEVGRVSGEHGEPAAASRRGVRPRERPEVVRRCPPGSATTVVVSRRRSSALSLGAHGVRHLDPTSTALEHQLKLTSSTDAAVGPRPRGATAHHDASSCSSERRRPPSLCRAMQLSTAACTGEPLLLASGGRLAISINNFHDVVSTESSLLD